MNNYIISGCINQEKNKIFIPALQWVHPVQDSEESTIDFPHRFTEKKRAILNTLLKFIGIYQVTHVSQQTIARVVGAHHDTVNRSLSIFSSLGLIKKTYRGANKTCIYSLGHNLTDPYNAWIMKDTLPNLYWAIMQLHRSTRSKIQELAVYTAAVFNQTVKHKFSTFNQNTARLFMNKLIQRNNSKNEEKEPKRDIVKVPIPRKKRFDEEIHKDHSAYFNEFAKILGITPGD